MHSKVFRLRSLICFVLCIGGIAVSISHARGQEYSYEEINQPENATRPAVIRDVEYGRKHWLGKTLWCGTIGLLGMNEDSPMLYIQKYAPLKVMEVRPSVNRWFTVEFIVKAPNGKLGRIHTYFTSSHLSYQPPQKYFAVPASVYKSEFSTLFVTKDPHLTYKWSKETWKAIENIHVLIGMNKQQVRFTWGEPTDINTTETQSSVDEQWVYEERNAYVYFRNGKVDAVQK